MPMQWLAIEWTCGTAVPHPLYDDYAQFPNTYDVGVILLSQPIYVAEYGELPALGQFDFLRTVRGPIGGTQNFVFTNDPGQGAGPGGTCSGDSGGPAFWIDPNSGKETNIVMAVNSYSITPKCNGNDYQMRTDIAEVIGFVTPYLTYP